MTSVVAQVVAVVAASPPPVEVIGDGPVAVELRQALAPSDGSGEPGTIVDTTGDPDQLLDALARVRALGTIVLAGPPPPAGVDLDAYADLHVRGLTVIGVADSSATS